MPDLEISLQCIYSVFPSFLCFRESRFDVRRIAAPAEIGTTSSRFHPDMQQSDISSIDDLRQQRNKFSQTVK